MTPDKRAFEALLDHFAMCERAMQITSMNEPCFAARREELNEARAAVLQAYDEAAGRDGEPYGWLAHDAIRGRWLFVKTEEAAHLLDYPAIRLFTHPAPKADAAADWVECEDCNGTGVSGDSPINMGDFQPPEWESCSTCNGSGKLAASPARVGEGEKDAARLNFIQREFIKVEPIEHPTGGGDSDVGWRLTDFYMAEPRERIVAEVFNDDLRSAIDAAMSREAQ